MSTPKTFDELPLSESKLSFEERVRWFNVVDPLVKYAGRPGDWGHDSKLGVLTQRLLQVRAELLSEGNTPEGEEADS